MKKQVQSKVWWVFEYRYPFDEIKIVGWTRSQRIAKLEQGFQNWRDNQQGGGRHFFYHYHVCQHKRSYVAEVCNETALKRFILDHGFEDEAFRLEGYERGTLSEIMFKGMKLTKFPRLKRRSYSDILNNIFALTSEITYEELAMIDGGSGDPKWFFAAKRNGYLPIGGKIVRK